MPTEIENIQDELKKVQLRLARLEVKPDMLPKITTDTKATLAINLLIDNIEDLTSEKVNTLFNRSLLEHLLAIEKQVKLSKPRKGLLIPFPASEIIGKGNPPEGGVS